MTTDQISAAMQQAPVAFKAVARQICSQE